MVPYGRCERYRDGGNGGIERGSDEWTKMEADRVSGMGGDKSSEKECEGGTEMGSYEV